MVHADLKPDNLFITTELKVIILNFGVANIIHSSDKAKTCVGTIDYLAPEKYSQIKYEPYKADCWSLGLILHYLCAQSSAFEGKSEL